MKAPRLRLAVLTVAALLAAGGAYYGSSSPRAAGAAHAQALPAAPQVDVAPALSQRVVAWQRYSGRLEAIDRVDVRPQVAGILTRVHFRDGQLVRKGDPLFTIDPRPYEANVGRAQAAVAAARARVAYTASELARGERLQADNAIARRDVEEKRHASLDAAAQLEGALASLEAARLDLAYTRITAPVDGRVSRAEITAGNVVSAGAQARPLTTLVSVARMYAAFDVDERTFLRHIHPASGANGGVSVQLGLAEEDGYAREGRVHSVDNQLDTASGTIRVRAVFDNADGRLVPGMYARVRFGGGAARESVLVDETAIGTDQDKRFVLVVDEHNRAAYRAVTLGDQVGALRVVAQGLAAGELIVVNGLQRLRPGDTVSPNRVSMRAAPATVVAHATPR